MLCCFCSPRYAKSERLRNLVNLVVVGGVIDPEDTGDREERAECEKMHAMIKECNLKVNEYVGSLFHLASYTCMCFNRRTCKSLLLG